MDLGQLAEVAHAILPDLRCDLNNPLRYNLRFRGETGLPGSSLVCPIGNSCR